MSEAGSKEMTTTLFLLRCCEVGISIRDLDLLTIGVVLDMWTEKSNDGVKYRRIADQADFDSFLGADMRCYNSNRNKDYQ